jgi:hypothetical protein
VRAENTESLTDHLELTLKKNTGVLGVDPSRFEDDVKW